MQAIQDSENRDTIIQNIRKNLRTLHFTANDTTLEWVRAHTGILGNEEADKIAKEATYLTDYEQISYINKASIKKVLRKTMTEKWQDEWNQSTKGRLTHQLFPKVRQEIAYSEIGNNKKRKLFIRAATGHFPINNYLHRINRSPSKVCPYCYEDDETLKHILVECRRYEVIRVQGLLSLGEDVSNMNLTLQKMMQDRKLRDITHTILKSRCGNFA